MRVRMSSRTDAGVRQHNEDSLVLGDGVNGHYAVLADGAGGHARGGLASQLAVQALRRVILDPGVAFSAYNLSQMVRLAHAELLHQQGSGSVDSHMYTTLVALWMEPECRHVLWTHVGDSRLYRLRQGRAELLTEDDSIVQQMVRSGMLSAEQSRHHPQKSHLLAALGMAGDVEPHTVVRPVELQAGDAFLLCTDGWWEHFDVGDLVSSLVCATSPEDWLDDMHSRIAERRSPKQDNFSAVAVWVGEPAEAALLHNDDTLPRIVRRR